jgi:hypothetical protein
MVYNVVTLPTAILIRSAMSAPPVIPPGCYRHYKGRDYEVIGIASHSETLEPMVVYRKLYDDGGLWVRPAAMFAETVVVDGRPQPRFSRLP